jgi:Tfp pilus assembly protein PilF
MRLLNPFKSRLATEAREIEPGASEAKALALIETGNAIEDENRLEEALAHYQQAISIAPRLARAHLNVGNIQSKLGEMGAAIESFEAAVTIDPAYGAGYYNLGNARVRAHHPQAALKAYDKAIELKPDFVDAHLARADLFGTFFRQQDAATIAYRRVFELAPDYADAHFSESLYLLGMGEYEAGWKKHEWRWHSRNYPAMPGFAQPLWLGKESLEGKTIFLHAEQGFGDTIQFCRYARLVAERGARVLLGVAPPLRSLLRNLDGVSQLVDDGALPGFDLHCPLMSLPYAFGTTLETIPAPDAYISADPGAVEICRSRMGPTSKPRIGIAWSGNPNQANDHNRSMALSTFVKLISDKAQFVSLQKDLRATDRPEMDAHPHIVRDADQLIDFASTAALVANLDLIVSVDTSVAHLAGAMGKPLWVLLPFTSDWRWLKDRSDCPWYPSARLFRQDESGDWRRLISTISTEIDLWLTDWEKNSSSA